MSVELNKLLDRIHYAGYAQGEAEWTALRIIALIEAWARGEVQ